MRRSIFIPIGLLLVASGIVAMVKAQDWNRLAATQQGEDQIAAVTAQAETPAGGTSTRRERTALGTANQPQAITSQASPSDLPEPGKLPLKAQEKEEQLPQAVADTQVAVASGTDETSPRFAPYGGMKSSRRQRTPKPAAKPEEPAKIETPQTVQQVKPNTPTTAVPSAAPTQSFAQPQPRLPQPRLSATRPSVGRPQVVTQPAHGAVSTGGQNVLLTTTGPAIEVFTTGPSTVTIGKQAEYAVMVKNHSNVAANDVSVLIEVPQWTDVANTQASRGTARYETVVGEQSRIRWNIAQLAASGTEILKLNLQANESRPFDLAVGWTFQPRTGRAQIEVQEPKLNMTLTGPRDVLYGETRAYTITVSNPGTGDAENVVVQLAPAVDQEAAGKSVIGTLAAGDRKVIEVELTARQAGQLDITAEATASGGLKASATEQVRVRRAAIEVTLSGPQFKYAGTIAAYEMRVANTGDATADSVVAAAALPRGSQFISNTDGGEYDSAQGRIDWKVGALRPGGVKMLEFRCLLGEAGDNRVEVAAAAAGQIGASTSSITKVEALADLKLLVNDPKGPLPVGEEIVYEVHIINRGTKAAEGIHIKSMFSEGIEPVSVEGGAAELGDGIVNFRAIPRLAAGQEVVLKIAAVASQPGAHVFRAELESTSPETILAQQETTRFYGDSIEPQQPAQPQVVTEQPSLAPQQPAATPQVETAEPTLPPRLR